MLVQAAAQQWQVDPASCTAANGEVTHAASGRTLAYGDLVDAASSRCRRRRIRRSRTPKDFTLIGKPLKRLDTPDKTDGKAIYGIDAMLPGMKFATLAACPVFGGKVGHVDDSAAKDVPGVRQVVVLDDLVAVVGDHMWAAKQGLDALVIDWDEGAERRRQLARYLGAICARRARRTASSRNRSATSPRAWRTGERLEAAYELPFLAHATDGADELHGASDAGRLRNLDRHAGHDARAGGRGEGRRRCRSTRSTVHNHLLGGGFGRRLEAGHGGRARCASPSRSTAPVKVVWTREEDIQHDIYRPVYRDTIAASLSDGKIVGWKYRVTGSSIMARWLPPAFQNGIDIDAVDSAVDIPYDIPNLHVEYVRAEPPARADRLLARRRPEQQRLRHRMLHGRTGAQGRQGSGRLPPRHAWQERRACWRRSISRRRNRAGASRCRRGSGAACRVQPSFGSFIATVVEAEVDEHGEVQLRRVTSAVDTGIAVNPDTIVAQLQGGLIFGLTAALYGEITIDKGRVQQSNFNDYRMLRIDEAPTIEVHLIKSGEAPGGIGETGATAAPPALRNAIYRRDRRRACAGCRSTARLLAGSKA